jgi:DNA-binding CsgD family transcriptional regulator
MSLAPCKVENLDNVHTIVRGFNVEDIAVQVLRALVHSSTLDTFFEKLSANLWGIEPILGFQIYLPGGPGTLDLFFKYTHASVDSPQSVELDSPSSCATAFNNRSICRDPKFGPVVSAPLEEGGILTGVFSLHLASTAGLERLREEDVKSMALAASAFLHHGRRPSKDISLRGRTLFSSSKQPTDRQIRILRLMRAESTYQQIARELHVSESLIKLEVSKIFKFLGVSRKSEAIEASRKLLEQAPPPRGGGGGSGGLGGKWGG